jgi:hypothetical protein
VDKLHPAAETAELASPWLSQWPNTSQELGLSGHGLALELAQAQWVEDCSQKPELSGQHVAHWAGARLGGGHGTWPSRAAPAAQGQADTAEVTAKCASGWRLKLASGSPLGWFYRVTFGSCLLLVSFFRLWLAAMFP